MGEKTVKVAFVDRDGVINAYPGHFKYVTCLSEFRILPGAAAGIRMLNQCGFRVVVVSNQAGVSKGLYTSGTLDEITREMRRQLEAQGARIDAVYYCTHRKEEMCACRKPATGMITAALEAFAREGLRVDLKESFFIGDSMTDMETGKAAGLAAILVFSGRERPENSGGWSVVPDYTAEDISAAARILCENKRSVE